MTWHRCSTESYTITIGALPGYDHSQGLRYEGITDPRIMAWVWSEEVGLPAVIQPAIAIYPSCQNPEGEPIFTILCTCNPYYYPDPDEFYAQLERGLEALTARLGQVTCQMVCDSNASLSYLRND